eukprot:751896-Hanusia_phi.AAC.3
MALTRVLQLSSSVSAFTSSSMMSEDVCVEKASRQVHVCEDAAVEPWRPCGGMAACPSKTPLPRPPASGGGEPASLQLARRSGGRPGAGGGCRRTWGRWRTAFGDTQGADDCLVVALQEEHAPAL